MPGRTGKRYSGDYLEVYVGSERVKIPRSGFSSDDAWKRAILAARESGQFAGLSETETPTRHVFWPAPQKPGRKGDDEAAAIEIYGHTVHTPVGFLRTSGAIKRLHDHFADQVPYVEIPDEKGRMLHVPRRDIPRAKWLQMVQWAHEEGGRVASPTEAPDPPQATFPSEDTQGGGGGGGNPVLRWLKNVTAGASPGTVTLAEEVKQQAPGYYENLARDRARRGLPIGTGPNLEPTKEDIARQQRNAIELQTLREAGKKFIEESPALPVTMGGLDPSRPLGDMLSIPRRVREAVADPNFQAEVQGAGQIAKGVLGDAAAALAGTPPDVRAQMEAPPVGDSAAAVLPPGIPPPGIPPPGIPPPGVPGGGIGMSVTTRGIPGGPGKSTLPNREPAIERAYQAEAQALEGASALAAKSLADEARLREQGLTQALEHQANVGRIQERVASEKQDLTDAYRQVVTQISSPAETVDPNRWWASRTTGQKVLAGIAAFLSGFSQPGQQTGLDIIENAINQDIDAQKFNIAERRGRLGQRAQAITSLYNLVASKGADEVEAGLLAKAAAWELVEHQIGAIKAQSQSQQVQAQAQVAVAQVQQRKLEQLTKADQHRETLAIDRARLGLEYRKLALAQAGGGIGEQLRAPQAESLGDLRKAEEMVADLRKRFGSKSVPIRAFDKLLAAIPKSDANTYNRLRALAVTTIAPKLGAGVLQDYDWKRWENIVPAAGDLSGEEMLEDLILRIQQMHDERLKSFEAAGFDVRGYTRRVPSTFDPAEIGAEEVQ